jgi:hypothetical protein
MQGVKGQKATQKSNILSDTEEAKLIGWVIPAFLTVK